MRKMIENLPLLERQERYPPTPRLQRRMKRRPPQGGGESGGPPQQVGGRKRFPQKKGVVTVEGESRGRHAIKRREEEDIRAKKTRPTREEKTGSPYRCSLGEGESLLRDKGNKMGPLAGFTIKEGGEVRRSSRGEQSPWTRGKATELPHHHSVNQSKNPNSKGGRRVAGEGQGNFGEATQYTS